jgi:hypothetical protein
MNNKVPATNPFFAPLPQPQCDLSWKEACENFGKQLSLSSKQNKWPCWQVAAARKAKADYLAWGIKRKADRERSDVLCAAIKVALDKDLRHEICSFVYIPPRPHWWGHPREEHEEYRLMTGGKASHPYPNPGKADWGWPKNK